MPFEENSWHRRIEWKIDRLGYHLTRLHLIWPTSSQIAPISHSSMATTRPTGSRLRVLREFAFKIAGWAAERLLPIVWGLLAPILLGLWAWGREGAEKLWVWVSGVWLWLAG